MVIVERIYFFNILEVEKYDVLAVALDTGNVANNCEKMSASEKNCLKYGSDIISESGIFVYNLFHFD